MNTETAAAAYARNRADIARLLDVLAMELDAMDAAAAKGATWGHEANAAKIRADLVGVVASASSNDPEAVAEFLADAAANA